MESHKQVGTTPRQVDATKDGVHSLLDNDAGDELVEAVLKLLNFIFEFLDFIFDSLQARHDFSDRILQSVQTLVDARNRILEEFHAAFESLHSLCDSTNAIQSILYACVVGLDVVIKRILNLLGNVQSRIEVGLSQLANFLSLSTNSSDGVLPTIGSLNYAINALVQLLVSSSDFFLGCKFREGVTNDCDNRIQVLDGDFISNSLVVSLNGAVTNLIYACLGSENRVTIGTEAVDSLIQAIDTNTISFS